MEAAPPSYEKATLIDYWDLIARYVPSNDLCSAALVCSRWHATFAPHLWGNPASHFGIENDRVYVALTRFKRTLQTARLLVRSLTHTLHLPPAHAEIYNGPHADWLRDILERLPNLQSLIVRGLPFFDHASLHALRHAPPKSKEDEPPPGVFELAASSGYAFQSLSASIPSFGLRLLDASRCSNVTSHSLAQALGRFETLLYLDLSFTYPAQDPRVLATLRRLTGLQVLKLRGISLSDSSLESLAQAIGLRVRSLDIRNNRISDRGVRILLDRCFASGDLGPAGRRSPALLPYLGTEMLEIYQGEDFEGYLRKAFTGSFISRLAIEDVPESGITHLYIAGNDLTAEGASGLVRSGRLHVLDIAAVRSGLARHPSLTGRTDSDSAMEMPGVEKLTCTLWKHASQDLTFLRIDHGLITRDTPNLHPEQVVQGRVELADTALPDLPANIAELDGTSMQFEAFELPTEMTPRYELPGDPMHFVVSPAINDTPHVLDDGEASTARRGSAFAPECLDSLTTETEGISLLSPVSALGERTLATFGTSMTPISPGTPVGSTQMTAIAGTRPRSYSSVADERRARLTAHTAGSHNLHPAMLPHLSTLMLTDVPSYAEDREASDRLIQFIRQCAEESRLATAQAKLDYALPPGRKGHASALKHSADKIFALKRIVLELAPVQSRRKSSKASPWQHNTTKSMTEDRDSEALWSAAETDFSFFGDGEECGLPSLEPGRFAHSLGSNEKEVSFGAGSMSSFKGGAVEPPVEPKYDTVALLSSFRKERKLAHQRNMAAGAVDPETEGYWDGVVQVVRQGGASRNDEEVDYYGNRFIGGWLYR
ncbi:hypothetical protein LTR36_009310 [Oleoguttula mirabilis]|uniref:F-box domain-containing protein n=1 Tax=Oleoguttula mirabilis TaxID=1507867 RepID=A0AAV9J7H8_9PEZI|nr:hypothetical protein LTR36_009310 [Oleoguttula mirabilis]